MIEMNKAFDRIEDLIARNEITAARAFTEMRQAAQSELAAARDEAEKLRGRVALIESAARQVVRAAPNSGPLWFQSEEINALCEAVKGNSEARLLRKQADSISGYADALRLWLKDTKSDTPVMFVEGVEASAAQADRYAQALRTQADELEKAGGTS
ncbi:hypothetical protein NLU14_08865 [Marinobacter sp. 71-i]|uniref:Uncharacterized protein n=1 Tax=Marinobacter iranensis TaxID=2962607 RepID=A0ABT5Y9U5_9GAMM|nr:hypothetical protein [Marinobacter iranensis]MDF0750341.1 hypothetical protein [Marinobacter iranensis]